MQSSNDSPAKISKKKPKPNNKTNSLARKRPGEDFKTGSQSCNRKVECKTINSQIPKELNTNQKENRNIDTQTALHDGAKEKQIAFKQNIENNRSPSNSSNETDSVLNIKTIQNIKMDEKKSKEEILAARQAKKNAKKGLNQNDKNTKNECNDVDKILKKSKINEKSVDNNCEISNKNEKNSVKPIVEKEVKKQDKKQKPINNSDQMKLIKEEQSAKITIQSNEQLTKLEKTREEILAEREAKKMAKQVLKNKINTSSALPANTTENLERKIEQISLTDKPSDVVEKKLVLSKAERRAIQEAQRAAKAKVLEDKQKNIKPKSSAVAMTKNVSNSKLIKESSPSLTKVVHQKSPTKFFESTGEYTVKLFKHLDRENLQEKNQFINHPQIHPAMVQLGEQVATRTVVGSNARCISFLKALKVLIQDFQTPPKKEFTRGLEENINSCVQYLHRCRPLAVSVSNAHKAIQSVLRHLSNDQPESELKMKLCEHIDTYIRDQIEKAAQAISGFVQQKISDGDVILTYSCSSLIYQILEDAHNRKIDFRVIVVDSRPFCEGQELLRKLVLKEIPCTYVLINAVGFIMPEVTKILMGAHALLANGYVMARTGTAQVALVAKSFNVPVLICCETHKFSERVQTDAIVYNELGNPDDLIINDSCKLANWQKGIFKISPLNLNYDITPPELVTAVVTEVAILPCTSVPVILRLKPTDLFY